MDAILVLMEVVRSGVNADDYEEVDVINAKLHYHEGNVHYVQTMDVKQEAIVELPSVETNDVLNYVAVVGVVMEGVADVLNVHHVEDVLEKRESKVEANDGVEINVDVAVD